MEPNPYAPPGASAEEARLTRDGGVRAWVDADTLVIRRDGASLPALCLRTGVPTTNRERRTIWWIPPWARGIGLLGVPVWKKAHLEFGVSEAQLKQRRRRSIVAAVLIFAGGGGLIATAFLVDLSLVASLPFAMLAAGVLVAFYNDRIAVERMSAEFAWIRGVHPTLLQRLPPWMGDP